MSGKTVKENELESSQAYPEDPPHCADCARMLHGRRQIENGVCDSCLTVDDRVDESRMEDRK